MIAGNCPKQDAGGGEPPAVGEEEEKKKQKRGNRTDLLNGFSL